jgi:hypothetical protein
MLELRRAALILAALLVLAAVAAAAAAPRPDVLHLKNGDRISGQVSGTTETSIRLVTPYGRLLVPREKIAKIVYRDGREELLSPPPGGPRPPRPVRLELQISGDSFWQAWDAHNAPGDPALRLLLAVDGQPVAAFTDRHLDPDMPGAVTNTFAFDPAQTSRTLWNDTRAQEPDIAPGKAALRLDLLPPVIGPRQLILKYQINLGSVEEPVWRDLAEAIGTFEASETAPSVVHVEQSRGNMTFGGILRRKKMKDVETFSVRLVEQDVSSR